MITQQYNKDVYRTKGYTGSYKKKLSKINKKRNRFNNEKLINNLFEDLEDSINDYELYGNPLYDMYGQLINKYDYEEYLAIEDPDWLEYLGRNLSSKDKLDYCDRVYKESEDDYNFTDEDIDYAVNSWNKVTNKQELDLVQRAMNAYQAVKDWQEA